MPVPIIAAGAAAVAARLAAKKLAQAAAKKAAAKTVKVSSNVTVKAKPGKRISSAEEARLKNINKPVAKLKPKYQAKANKAEAKLMKAAAKPKPKTDTTYKTFTNPNNFDFGKITARDLAKQEVEKRAALAAAAKRNYR